MTNEKIYSVVRDLDVTPPNPQDNPQRSLLSRPWMLWHYLQGNIVIHPFDLRSVNTTSYDARLGAWFFRESRARGGQKTFNPFDRAHVERYWGQPQLAVPAGPWMRENGPLENITDGDFLVIIEPGETILAHTCEFIGGRNIVTTEMRARSSAGRIGLTVCKCAGWGDVGFCNRWTMEATNLMDNSSLVLPVGMRVAQIAFYQVDPIQAGGTYAGEAGKYQTTDDIDEMIRNWRPTDMLPRLYRDRDIGRFREHIPPDLLEALKAQI